MAFRRGPEVEGSNPSNEISSRGLLLRFSTTEMPWLIGTGVRGRASPYSCRLVSTAKLEKKPGAVEVSRRQVGSLR